MATTNTATNTAQLRTMCGLCSAIKGPMKNTARYILVNRITPATTASGKEESTTSDRPKRVFLKMYAYARLNTK